MLKSFHTVGTTEAGCDEAGRGCLAGPVFAAAVILPPGYQNSSLDDSKKLSALRREQLRKVVEREALAFGIGVVDEKEIDAINILNASFLAMHRALSQLKIRPGHLIIDGNRFKTYGDVAHTCVVKGDGKYASIAAASILAKTYRDEFMGRLHQEYPVYGWIRNKGYPTQSHRKALMEHGPSPYHRRSFRLLKDQMELDFS
ncbi:MAG: ribonuclease HII [Bacteroidia bacterium]|nr:MAG: ribonuclease HII [Bacteroidia bacterium]